SVHPAIKASQSVSEVFGELVVPLLRNLRFARNLQIEGAYRYSDYSNYDPTHTWKVGAIWSPLTGISFRAVRSYSVRTPNFGELYNPTKLSLSGAINDPCNDVARKPEPRNANCTALGVPPGSFGNYSDTVMVYSGGNPNLQPEESNSLTLGAI